MSDPRAVAQKLWKALQSDRTLMLGIHGEDDSHAQPMTAQIEDESGPIWFFSARDVGLVQKLGAGPRRAIAAFAAKGHDLFASIHGQLRIDHDRAVIERLWNSFVAAWYEGGMGDPKLVLLRLDPEHAQVWRNENNLLAGIKLLLGIDPKRDYADKVADVALP